MRGDTIYALASPPGPAARGIVRLSGPAARAAVETLGADAVPPRRGVFERAIDVLGARVPCCVLGMPAPHSYTGEDVVELHLPGSHDSLLLPMDCSMNHYRHHYYLRILRRKYFPAEW